jgi:hypothetical protein
LELVADGAQVAQEFASFKKRSIDLPYDCNAIASFYDVAVKLQKSYEFLTDFKI